MAKKDQWQIAVLPGDGVGPEVMAQALRVLDALQQQNPQLQLNYQSFDWPSHAWHKKHGQIAPDDYLQQLADFDVILLGALGDPGPVSDSDRYVLSDGQSLAPLLEIRQHFDQWACERICRPLPGAPEFLKDERAKAIDMLVIRENSEGEYVGHGGRLAQGTENEVVTQTSVFSYRATQRIIRHAFKQAKLRAQQRREEDRERQFGKHRSQVCLITKRNALKHWGEMYTQVFAQVAKDYPDVATHHELVDAACMKFVSQPWRFDVVVASNLHGDILTDLAAVLNGGMGVSPSCNINPADRSRPPMFEPTHGSAPDIAGQNKAGPTAMFLTAAQMLAWMGEDDPQAKSAAQQLNTAVAADLAKFGQATRATDEVADAVIERINKQ